MKEIKKAIDNYKLNYQKSFGSASAKTDVDVADKILLAEIKKIFLGGVGEDRKVYKPTNEQVGPGAFYDLSKIEGYNAAKAEIRKKIEGEL